MDGWKDGWMDGGEERQKALSFGTRKMAEEEDKGSIYLSIYHLKIKFNFTSAALLPR